MASFTCAATCLDLHAEGRDREVEVVGVRSRNIHVLTLPGRITKNGRPRRLALEGPLRAIIERRLAARRLDCKLIFWREHQGAPTAKLQPGVPVRIYEFRKSWRTACRKAGIQAGKGGRIFHDLPPDGRTQPAARRRRPEDRYGNQRAPYRGGVRALQHRHR